MIYVWFQHKFRSRGGRGGIGLFKRPLPIAAGYLGDQRVAGIKPLAQTAAAARDFHLPPAECFLTQDAEPLVIERTPVPDTIRGSENTQPLIQWQVGFDRHVISLPGSSIYSIGTQNDIRIGEILTATLVSS